MKAFSLGLTVLVILVVAAHGQSPAGAAKAPANYVADEVIVKLASAGDLPAVAAAFGLDPAPIGQFGANAIYRLHIVDGADPRAKAGELALDPRVLYADPNFIGSAPEPVRKVSWAVGGDGAAFVGQWAANRIRLAEAHSVSTGTGITVAVIDTGIDLAHPVFAGHLVPGYDFVDMDAVPQEVGLAGSDPAFGHGTHVAGLVALVAPDARIMPLRVLDRAGAGNIWVLAEALHFAADPDGDPSTPDGADVVNLSLTMPRKSRLIRDVIGAVTCAEVHQTAGDLACFRADGYGATVVAAAGNSSSNTREFPAGLGLGGELAVGASAQDDGLAGFSNFGSWVGLMAPGENMLSAVPGGAYGTWSGTSMASPIAAGVAALVRAAFPSLDSVQTARRLIATSATVASVVPRRLDAASALTAPLPED